MSAHILNNRILKSIEKTLKLQSNDGNGDTNKHIEHVDNMLDYYHTQVIVKCKLFSLTSTRSIMNWFNILLDGSINSLRNLCEAFNARKRKPTTMVILSRINQEKKDTLHEFINHFRKVAAAIWGMDDRLKC